MNVCCLYSMQCLKHAVMLLLIKGIGNLIQKWRVQHFTCKLTINAGCTWSPIYQGKHYKWNLHAHKMTVLCSCDQHWARLTFVFLVLILYIKKVNIHLVIIFLPIMSAHQVNSYPVRRVHYKHLPWKVVDTAVEKWRRQWLRFQQPTAHWRRQLFSKPRGNSDSNSELKRERGKSESNGELKNTAKVMNGW